MRSALFALAVVASVGCGGETAEPAHPVTSAPAPTSAPEPARPAEPKPVPFDLVGQEWPRFEATIGDTVSTHLILDTGGGVTLLSDALCKKLKCVPDGTFTGKRMSGQAITLQMFRVPSIVIAGHRVENTRVAVMDTTSLLHPELGVDGFAGLDLFRDQPFTIDYTTKTLTLEDESSLAKRRASGREIKVRVENEGPSTVLYLPLELKAGAPPLEMEVDSGSQDLILDDRFMEPVGFDPKGPGVRRVEGKDETANPYVRTFGPLPHTLHVPGGKEIAATGGVGVMFQKIIHDGLVGYHFLAQYKITYDIPGSTMIFGTPDK